MQRIIDAHFHIWDPAVQSLPWLDGDDGSLRRRWDFIQLAEDYRHVAGVSLAGAVYVEVDAADPVQEDRLIVSNPEPHIIGHIMRSAIEPAMRVPIFANGVREPLHTPSASPGRCRESAFIEGLRALGRRGLTFDACMRVEELTDLAITCREVPETAVVLDHMGNVTPETFNVDYRCAMQALAACPNVAVKVSGYPTGDPAFVRDLLAFARDTFAPDRLMYASNWPVVTTYGLFEEHLNQLLDAFGGDDGFFAGNAAHIYHLKGLN